VGLSVVRKECVISTKSSITKGATAAVRLTTSIREIFHGVGLIVVFLYATGDDQFDRPQYIRHTSIIHEKHGIVASPSGNWREIFVEPTSPLEEQDLLS